MAIKICAARSDENGNISGGRDGDQTGKEIVRYAWAKHSKGWRVLRCNDPEKAEKIAKAVEMAADNNLIGYNQVKNQDLWKEVKDKGYDPSKASKPCSTDCARLSRVCVAYAGIIPSDYYSATCASALLATKQFTELKGKEYTDSDKLLKRGDILTTRTKGHVAIVIEDGPNAKPSSPPKDFGTYTIQFGDEGADVKQLQNLLLKIGMKLPKWGADSDYGTETEDAVKAYQKLIGLSQTGKADPETIKQLILGNKGEEKPIAPPPPTQVKYVKINSPTTWNCRTKPNTTGKIIGTVRVGETYEAGPYNDGNFREIIYFGQKAYVSCKATGEAEELKTVKVTNGSYYIRESASTSSKSLGVVTKGTSLTCWGYEDGEFTGVVYLGREAYLGNKALN